MLKFQEIITYSYEIDPSIVEDYLNDCEADEKSPNLNDLISYLYDNFDCDDFEKDCDSKYSITDKEFNKYIKNFRTEFPND